MEPKKYFAKYLPIKGDYKDLKEGELIAVSGADGDGPIKFTKYTGQELGICRAKLFLCTHDIQVGDIIFIEGIEINYPNGVELLEKHKHFGYLIFKDSYYGKPTRSVPIDKERGYKIVGEILTPDIQQDQKFTEEEIKSLEIKKGAS